MRVGFVIFTDLNSLKGDATHVKSLLKELEKCDLHVEALIGRPSSDERAGKYRNLLTKMTCRLSFLFRIVAVRKRFDLFYLRDWLFAWLLSFCRIPFAFEINGLLPYEGLIRDYFRPGSLTHRFFRRIERRVLTAAAKIVSVSHPIQDYCVTDLGLDPRKIVVAENGADTSVFHPDVPRMQIERKENEILVGWMGSFESQHGFEDFLAIAARLKNRNCSGVRFLIIGGGPAREQLEQRLAEAGLEDYFLFCGRVRWDQIPGYMLNADFCLSLYRRTRANLEYRARTGVAQIKIFEYLALGKPVLAYDHGDARAFFADRRIGWVCPMKPEAVADRIMEIAKEPEQIHQYGRGALALSRERYNWAATARRIANFLQES